MLELDVADHMTTGPARPVLVWRFPAPMLSIATAPVGGGIGERRWVLNAQVGLDYERQDLDEHVTELAVGLDCNGAGVGMLTAASYEAPSASEDVGVQCWATVGISKPTWAADTDDSYTVWRPGTINTVVLVPVRLSDAALVNAIVTATEAKTQALIEAGVPGTGTASDAVCVLCPFDGPDEMFGGPRSVWGARVARAVHAAVASGIG